jgi:hypothetical protein
MSPRRTEFIPDLGDRSVKIASPIHYKIMTSKIELKGELIIMGMTAISILTDGTATDRYVKLLTTIEI